MDPRLTFSWSMPGGAWAVGGVVVLGALVLAWSLPELLRQPRGPRRAALLTLRTAAVVGAVLMVLGPTWSGAHVRPEPGRLLVLVDDSRSMAVPAGESSRFEGVKGWVAERSRGEGGERMALLRVGAGSTPTSAEDLAALEAPTATASRLLDGVASAAESKDVGAVLLLSDGAERGSRVTAETVAGTGVKVHTVLVGGDERFADAAITDVKPDAMGFLRQEGRVRVTVRSSMGERTVRIFLQRSGMPIHESTVELDEGGRGVAEVPFVPDRLGRNVYELSIPLAEGDAVPANNRAAFLLPVRRDKLRVLHVAGRPSWDERFLRGFLKRDPSIDLVSFFILRSATDLAGASPSDMALIPFPTDELFSQHLESFDVVVFQNFNYGPYQMAPYLGRIRDYVAKGGAFAMIGGELGLGAGGYADTAIQEVLPVTLPRADATPSTQFVLGRFRPEPDERMMLHPLVALGADAAGSRALWGELAPVEGANRLLGLRAGGAALLRHPSEAVGGERMPLLVTGRHGEGRVLVLAVDTSWRWGMTTGGFSGDASAYHAFWDRALRWLASDPALDPSSLETDRERVVPGSEVSVRGLVRNERYVPVEGELTWRVVPHDERRGSTAPQGRQGTVRADVRGAVSWRFRAPEDAGVHRLVVTDAADHTLAEQVFLVESGADELRDPWPNRAFLEGLAQSTGGRFFASPGAVPAWKSLDATRNRVVGTRLVRPFATPWVVGPWLLFLGAEWWLRRRVGLR